ncbi:MAG: hypothetical protein ABFS19_02425 [Thermodesulfobacteriota bacterium]
MIDLIKKAMFMGLGAASLTKEKVEEVAREFVDKGKLSQQEGEKLVDELMKKSDQAKDDLKEQVSQKVEEVLAGMNLAKKEDVTALRQEIEDLRQEIQSSD